MQVQQDQRGDKHNENNSSTHITTQNPGPKDILVGRGRRVLHHVGNRVFRKVIDLHMYDYVSSQSRRYFKAEMVKSIANLFRDDGYRFFKHNTTTGLYYAIDEAQAATKIGQALQDRVPLLGSIRREQLKTRAQLIHQGVSLVTYAESLIYKTNEPDDTCSSPSAGGNNTDAFIVAPTMGPRTPRKNANQSTDNPFFKHLSLQTKSAISGFSSIPYLQPGTWMTEDLVHAEGNSSIAMQTVDSAASFLIPVTNGNETVIENGGGSAPQNIRRTINEIVIPTMQNGNLPAGGYWKFFPLPEIADHVVEMGPSMSGWKLKLEPISFIANPVFLNVV